ncbi:MAG: carboxypeptidase regulatory-like domain-containing protein [Deltaproteobacteria bacterium]|nr:carboxypeptidase regulatory-like domain-containing protein [Deltaproteobacteria bacterium]MBW1933115.1 carboxypeptidase regulatory-like domain-containing protein [Deltaproteobacteria bacterium]
MRDFFVILCCISIATPFSYASSLYAHGVRGKTGKGGIVVIAEYSTGEPMSYAKVVITAPDKKIPFQIGRTDRNGRFCFFPDVPGQWVVVVSDEMGHRLEVTVPVDKHMKLQSTPQQKKGLFGGMSVLHRAFMGLSLIFGATGIIMWWMVKKRQKTYPSNNTSQPLCS